MPTHWAIKNFFKYNSYRQIIETIFRSGLHFYFVYDSTGKDAKCIHTWGDGNVLGYKFFYFPKEEKTISENSLGYSTTYYHKNGLVIKEVDPYGNITLTEYNENSEPTSVTDAMGNNTQYYYDSNGNLTEARLPNGATKKIKYENNMPVSEIGEDGEQWKWEYDEIGHLQKQIDPLGHETNYVYKDGQLTGLLQPAQEPTLFHYNAAGQLICLQEPNGQKKYWEYNLKGLCTTVIYPNGLAQRLHYDAAGNVIKIEEPDGNVRYITYNAAGKPILAIDNNRKIAFTYNSAGKISSRTEKNHTIYFAYDTELNLTCVTNEHGEKYHFEFDGNGYLVKEIGFDGVTRSYQRNAIGKIDKLVKPNGKQTTFTYNKLGMATQIAYSDGSMEQYGYSLGGKLLKASNENGSISFAYDAFGRLLSETTHEGTVQSTYDLFGLRIQISSTLGADIQLAHNNDGQVSTINANGWLANIGYSADGSETSRILPGNIKSRWLVDSVGHPLVHQVENSNARSLHKNYAWGTNNILLHVADLLKGEQIEYQYNDRLHLTGAQYSNNALPELRIIDAVGNLFESIDKTDRSYGSGGRLLEKAKTRYTYDDEGNLTKKTDEKGNNWQYIWNASGMLSEVVRPDGEIVTFGYDALGRRLWKRFKHTITKWLWDQSKPLHEWKEFDAKESTPDDLITWVFEENSFTPAAKLKKNKQYSIISDHLGTPIQGYDTDGNLIWERQLDINGSIKMLQGDQGFCQYLYQGQTTDIETGLVYNRFRYYNPADGIYISQDPIRLISGENNLYAFVSDTNKFIDIFGLAKTTRFYHAGSIKGNIDLSRSEKNKDFNPAGKGGFYVTTDLEQAKEWAKTRNVPIVQYDVPNSELVKLNIKTFDTANAEWETMVKEGRAGTLTHNYDAVSGPMLLNPAQVRKGKNPIAGGSQVALFSKAATELFNFYKTGNVCPIK